MQMCYLAIRRVHTVSTSELTCYYDALKQFAPRSYQVRLYVSTEALYDGLDFTH